jgi:hypothetical protein
MAPGGLDRKELRGYEIGSAFIAPLAILDRISIGELDELLAQVRLRARIRNCAPLFTRRTTRDGSMFLPPSRLRVFTLAQIQGVQRQSVAIHNEVADYGQRTYREN